MEVAIGIDTHMASLAAAAVDPLGRVLAAREFTNDPAGHRLLVRWVREQAHPRRIGIEGSMNYGASVVRTLTAGGEDVREVSPLLTYVERRRRSKGKSDPIDAVAIARVAAADETLPSARRAALLSNLKLLVDDRDQLVRSLQPRGRSDHVTVPLVASLRVEGSDRHDVVECRALVRGRPYDDRVLGRYSPGPRSARGSTSSTTSSTGAPVGRIVGRRRLDPCERDDRAPQHGTNLSLDLVEVVRLVAHLSSLTEHHGDRKVNKPRIEG